MWLSINNLTSLIFSVLICQTGLMLLTHKDGGRMEYNCSLEKIIQAQFIQLSFTCIMILVWICLWHQYSLFWNHSLSKGWEAKELPLDKGRREREKANRLSVTVEITKRERKIQEILWGLIIQLLLLNYRFYYCTVAFFPPPVYTVGDFTFVL